MTLPNFPRRTCTPITAVEFDAMREGARILESDRRGDKVLLTPDNRIIKLFYPRRLLTSARLYPYAFRFRNNAKHLLSLGINTVQCEQLRYDRSQHRHLVTYPLLAGTSLRECLEGNRCGDEDLEKLAAYLATLHSKGILFRSIHLGNILVLEDGGFGLIDVADMTIRRWPLGLFRRARNFRHLLHDHRDREVLDRYGCKRFFLAYETAAGVSGLQRRLLRALVGYYAPVFVH